MKKNVLKKVVAASMVCVSLGGPLVEVAATTSTQQLVTVSDKVLDEFPIKNGDFNDGLEHWIVSSPGTNNPALITEGGNNYVKATNGENIHQYLTLEPNKTYKFAYDAAGDKNFPAKVEFGTLNHGEAFIPLKQSEHSNEDWERKQFSFSTSEKENTYIIRFSSTGDGWAKFDNIQVYVEDTEAPTAPKNLKASEITEKSVKLDWEASTDNVGVTGYQIFRDNQKIETVSGEELTFTDKNLKDNTNYSYTVRAIDAAGNISEKSNLVTIKTKENKDTEAPTAPKNLKASDITVSSVKLDWEASTDNVGVTGYQIFRDNKKIETVSGARLTFTDKNLKDNTNYSYIVRAIDAAGNISEKSNLVTIKTKEDKDTEAPTAPPYLRASKISDISATLVWGASTDNVGVTGYQIFRDNKHITTVNGSTLTFTDNSLVGNRAYKYFVKAIDAAGNVSTSSNLLGIITSEPKDRQAPTAPKNLTGSSDKVGEVQLKWGAATDNVGVVSYQIFQDNKQITTVNGSTLSYTAKNLKKGQTVSFKVRAVDAAGNVSTYSNSVSVEVKALILSEVHRASLDNNEIINTSKTFELDRYFKDKYGRNELDLVLFDANKKRLNINDFDVLVSNTAVLGNTNTSTNYKTQGHINLPIRGKGTVTISLKHKKEGYTHKVLTVKVTDISPVDTVLWVSKPTSDEKIKPGGDIVFSSWYKDKQGRREINLILKKGNKVLDMTKYDVLSSNTGAVGNSTTSTTYKKKGHANLPMVKPGMAKITIREKATNRVFEVATLYHSYL